MPTSPARYAIGCDHAGLPLKAEVRAELEELGHTVTDLGTYTADPMDYPDIAEAVARAVASGQADRGVILCGSGVGACVAANKVKGIRAGTCHDTFSAHQGVEDDDMNVLCLGARVIGPLLAREIVRSFAGARFSGAERHRLRVDKLIALEDRFGQT
ncbi:MAG: ribose 5-phosphate isomerase B [Dehalococcoidia bacterium]|nr:ribose 5-phosphate isomerase B [Dehalococcoidia bacterium]